MLINKNDKKYSIRKQCQLFGINRSSLYYEPVGISEQDQKLMNALDKQHTKTPFYGILKKTKAMKDLGYKVGKDHVKTLLRKMGLETIFPKPFTSKSHPENKVYPYLLKDVEVIRPNHVWSADITYIRLARGFAYLVAIIDWYSRCVLSWKISNTLSADFCVEALIEALRFGKPEIFNTDQGCQFTSQDFINKLLEYGIAISMDGRGRVFDNIFVERLWRTVKYENIYISGYQNIPELKGGLRRYFNFYNMERYHQALDYKRPWEVYSGSIIMPGGVIQENYGGYILSA